LKFPEISQLLNDWHHLVFQDGKTNYSLARSLLLPLFPPFRAAIEKDLARIKYGELHICYATNQPLNSVDLQKWHSTDVETGYDWDAVWVSEQWQATIYRNGNKFYLEAWTDYNFLDRPEPIRINQIDPSAVPDSEMAEPKGVVLMKVDVFAHTSVLKKDFVRICKELAEKHEKPKQTINKKNKNSGRPNGKINFHKDDALLFDHICKQRTPSNLEVSECLDKYGATQSKSRLYQDAKERLMSFVNPHKIGTAKATKDLKTNQLF
jgi:hypothetical protein